MKIYLVGGAVRDRLLDRPPGDRDWVVVGATQPEMEALGYKAVGKDFPVFLHPDTGEEYALARTERKSGRGYRGFVVDADPSVTLEEDLLRRAGERLALGLQAAVHAVGDRQRVAVQTPVVDHAERKNACNVLAGFLVTDDAIRRESARNAIDPAWVAAEIRAESIFNPKARSPANAMGLMQVLPATGASVAKTIGLTNYGGAASLYDADTNIAVGTAYLRQLMNKYEGLPYVTIAAYNAGPTPTARWQSQRPGFDPDIWIETISYKETREYVARILAFSVIYDWRLNGDALPVTDRMNGRLQAKRKAFACPTDADKGGD